MGSGLANCGVEVVGTRWAATEATGGVNFFRTDGEGGVPPLGLLLCIAAIRSRTPPTRLTGGVPFPLGLSEPLPSLLFLFKSAIRSFIDIDIIGLLF